MKSLLFILLPFLCFSQDQTLFFKSGEKVNGLIIEANSTHLILKRSSDFQKFKFKSDLLTEESRKQIELYFAENRYKDIEKLELPLNEKSVKKFASYVDQLIEENLKNKRLQKTKALTDGEFARRAYLTIVGRIPAQTELLEFTNNRSPNKRFILTEKLLNSNGYVNHQLNWWGDMLRIKDRTNGVNINIGGIYKSWLRDSLSSKKPYDQIVRELISSNGRLLENKEGAAVSYFLRDRGMQEDNLSHTIRIFLGTRLQCAMCHDHPFDRWTQKEFYQMTAFTSGVGSVKVSSANKEIGKLSKAIAEGRDERSGVFNNWRNQIRDSLVFGLENNGSGKIKLPRDFAGEVGEPGDVVLAKVIFTPKPILDPSHSDAQSRKILAEWITSEDNPRFTTMISNRIWKNIFGAGLIEPIDSMVDDTMPSNVQLMRYLERLMVGVDFNLREYQKVLLNSKLFQRKSNKEDYKSLENYNFEGPILRRMTGEQLWDSLVTLVYNNIDEPSRIYLHNNQDYSVIFNRYKNMSGSEIYEDIKNLADKNPGDRNFLKIIEIENETRAPIKFLDRNLVRSSYLQSPAPGGHLIRQFGGSDREQIDNSNKEPNTPQVLNLLNGFVESNILNKKNADFIKAIQLNKSKQDQIENIFLSILSRKPSTKEASLLKGIIDKKDGFKHVSWILLNSHEFIFIR